MNLEVLLFGITRDIIGGNSFKAPLTAGENVGDLKEYLFKNYPRLKELRSLLIAVNNEYAEDDVALSAHDEVALIPPVSGG